MRDVAVKYKGSPLAIASSNIDASTCAYTSQCALIARAMQAQLIYRVNRRSIFGEVISGPREGAIVRAETPSAYAVRLFPIDISRTASRARSRAWLSRRERCRASSLGRYCASSARNGSAKISAISSSRRLWLSRTNWQISTSSAVASAPANQVSVSPCRFQSWRYKCGEPAYGRQAGADSGDGALRISFTCAATRRPASALLAGLSFTVTTSMQAGSSSTSRGLWHRRHMELLVRNCTREQCSQRRTSRPGSVTGFATGICTSVVAIICLRRARAGLP